MLGHVVSHIKRYCPNISLSCYITLLKERVHSTCNKGVYIALDQTRVCSSQAQCSKGVYITRMLKRACRSQRDPLWVMVQLMLTSQSGFNIEAGQYKFWVWVKYCSVCYWLVMIQQVCNATSYHYHDRVRQGAGMVQTIIRNTTSMRTVHSRMYSNTHIELWAQFLQVVQKLMKWHSHLLQRLHRSQLNLVSVSSNLSTFLDKCMFAIPHVLSSELIIDSKSLSSQPNKSTSTIPPCPTPNNGALPSLSNSRNKTKVNSPRTFRCPVPLSPVLEPVGHLRE